VCLNKITKPPVCGSEGPYKDCRATDEAMCILRRYL
jgi:hypothetical protein